MSQFQVWSRSGYEMSLTGLAGFSSPHRDLPHGRPVQLHVGVCALMVLQSVLGLVARLLYSVGCMRDQPCSTVEAICV